MTRIRHRTILVAAIGIIAIIVFAATLVHAVLYDPDSSIPVPDATSTPLAATDSSIPVRLRIPSLNINANVQDVGVNALGNLATPNNFTDVAWYKLGTVPGQIGSAVIDGHVDNGLSLAGVFKHLDDITVGADVYVDTQNGTTLHFVVTDIENYPYKDVPVDQIFNPKDAARLNLITCNGGWVPGEKTYDHRLVVYTELAQS